MSRVGSLTIYGGRSGLSSFDDMIRDDAVVSAHTADHEGKDEDDNDWSARLYVWQGVAREPSWAGFVRDGFGPLALPTRTSLSVAIIVRVRYYVDRYFAVTFGGGRFKLHRARIVRGYGLKVALNAIYEQDHDAAQLDVAPLIRQVETRTVGPQTMRALQQANRLADFDAFGTDAEIDEITGVTGRPFDDVFGTRMTGKDSLRLGRPTLFEELGKLCRQIAKRHPQTTYQRRFRDLFDRVEVIDDAADVASLRTIAAQRLADGDDFEFAPPELIDFDRVDHFALQVPGEDEIVMVDPTGAEIREALDDAAGSIDPDTIGRAMVAGRDAEGELFRVWPLWECLDTQFVEDGATFLLADGDFRRVDPDYLTALDNRVAAISESAIVLPNSRRENVDGAVKEIDEGTYNEEAATTSDDFLNLDKQTVRVAGHTSPIEICDILSTDGKLVHVKRKFASSSLSHLFGQGAVSGQLLVSSDEFRKEARNRAGAATPFGALFADGLAAANYEIVYAIIGDWSNRTLTDLPFFSKINLAHHARSLRTLGFTVTYSRIDIDG